MNGLLLVEQIKTCKMNELTENKLFYICKGSKFIGGVKSYYEMFFPFYFSGKIVGSGLKMLFTNSILVFNSTVTVLQFFPLLFIKNSIFIVLGNELIWNRVLKKNYQYQRFIRILLYFILTYYSRIGRLYTVSDNNMKIYCRFYKRDLQYKIHPNLTQKMKFSRKFLETEIIHICIICGFNKIKRTNEVVKFFDDLNSNRYIIHVINNTNEIKSKNTNIIGYGYLRKEKFEDLLTICQFCIINSRTEGYPMIVSEAQSKGCIVLVKDSVTTRFSENLYLYFRSFNDMINIMETIKREYSTETYKKLDHGYILGT